MARFIELTDRREGKPIAINVDHVTTACPDGGGTVLWHGAAAAPPNYDDASYAITRVAEPYADVLRLLKGVA